MKKIYIFRGAPASGKGTITEAFMQKLPGKVAFLELDKFRWGFHRVNRSVFEVTEEEHALAYKNYLAMLENYLADGNYTIVTEGLFSSNTPSPHGNLEDVMSLVAKYDYEPVPILLYAPYDVLWDRNQKREYSVPEEEFKQLYDHVMQAESLEEHKIDVAQTSVDEAVAQLLQY